MSDTQRREGAPFPGRAHCPPPGPPHAAGGPGGDWLTEDAAEALLTVPPARQERLAELVFADEYAARSALRLAGVLTAAREAVAPLDPDREEAALAAYRAARHAFIGRRSARWRRVWRRTDHRPVLAAAPGRARVGPRRVAAAALASVLALGGVTVAMASAGRLLTSGGGGAGSGPVSSGPASVAPDGGTQGAPTAPGTGSVQPPDPHGTAPVPPAHSTTWCRAYLRGHRHGRVTGSPALTSYCRHLVKEAADKKPGKSPDAAKDGNKSGKKATGAAAGGNNGGQGKSNDAGADSKDSKNGKDSKDSKDAKDGSDSGKDAAQEPAAPTATAEPAPTATADTAATAGTGAKNRPPTRGHGRHRSPAGPHRHTAAHHA